MVTIPISILMIITITFLLVAIVASCLLATAGKIKNAAIYLFTFPVMLFLVNFVMCIIAGILDPKLDTGKTIKEGIQGIGYIFVFMILVNISFLIVAFVAKIIYKIFEIILGLIGSGMDNGILGKGGIATQKIIRTMINLSHVNSEPGHKMPIFLYPIQFVIYLPFYLLGFVLLLMSRIGKWCQKNYEVVGLILFIILDVITYIESNGENHAFIFLNYFFNKQKWADYMALKGTVGAPVGCSSLTYMFFTIYWTLVEYITPVAIVTYLLYITFDKLDMDVKHNDLKISICEILRSVNNQSATLFATNKGKLVLNYAIVLLFYGAVYYACNYFFHFILII